MRRTAGLFLAPALVIGSIAGVAVHEARAGVDWGSGEQTVSVLPEPAFCKPSGRAIARLPDGSIYAAWYVRLGVATARVRGSLRSPGGVWQPQEETISLGDSLSRNPVVAAGPSGEVHVAWEDTRDGNEEIYYRLRSPEGTWGPEERVTTDDAPSAFPVVAVSSTGRLHLVWSDGQNGTFELYHQWRDPGGPWSAPLMLTTSPGNNRTPFIDVDQAGEVHVAWQDYELAGAGSPANTEIYYMRLSPTGDPEISPVLVSDALGTSQNPTLTVSPEGIVYIFWSDNRDRAPGLSGAFPFAIWFRRWLPGLGFGHEKRFAYSASSHLNPTAALQSGGTVNVIWEDDVDGNLELYFRQITPATGWDIQPTRLTFSLGPTTCPTLIAEPGSRLDLLWSDVTAGDEASIRYRTGITTDGTPVIMDWIDARWQGDQLQVRWRTASEIDHAGFLLYAAEDPFDEARLLTPRLITGGPEYSATLGAGLDGARYIKLVDLSRHGTLEVAALLPIPAREVVDAAPARLTGAWPNPSRGAVHFGLTGAAGARLEIVDLSGRRVASLVAPSGGGEVAWDGRQAGGRPAPSGRYWARLVTPSPGGRGPALSFLVVR